MANSLRAKLSKLRYERNITDTEYQELIKKLDGHDKQIRVDVIEEFAERLSQTDINVSNYPMNQVTLVKMQMLKE